MALLACAQWELAHTVRAHRLGLKDQQEREIVHVLVDCCLQEKTYNPFYALLAGKFCAYERRFQVTSPAGPSPTPAVSSERAPGHTPP